METQQAYVQPENKERQNLERVSEVLRHVDERRGDNQSMAAGLARLFAEYINASWTWKGVLHSYWIMIHDLATDLASYLSNEQRASKIGCRLRKRLERPALFNSVAFDSASRYATWSLVSNSGLTAEIWI